VFAFIDKGLRQIGGYLAAGGLYVSIILSTGIFFAGLLEIAVGTRELFSPMTEALLHPSAASKALPNSGAGSILKGLELLFLAPAVGLTFAGSVVYLKTKIDRMLRAIGGPGLDGDSSRIDIEDTISSEMYQVKISVTALMISVLLTDLISRVIAQGPVETSTLQGIGLGTALCLAYFFVLIHAHHLPLYTARAESRKTSLYGPEARRK
jgi:hypothetical protein